ncbi:FCGR3 protein, partial [Callaeas wilsoni]|nr:FCGR3 protein [Callaeas wilsoni]
SPSVTGPPCPTDWLVLQVPAPALLVGDMVTLRCRVRQEKLLPGVQFYHEEKDLEGLLDGTEMSLFPLQQHHSGCYHCGGWVSSGLSQAWEKSVPVTVCSECGAGDC